MVAEEAGCATEVEARPREVAAEVTQHQLRLLATCLSLAKVFSLPAGREVQRPDPTDPILKTVQLTMSCCILGQRAAVEYPYLSNRSSSCSKNLAKEKLNQKVNLHGNGYKFQISYQTLRDMNFLRWVGRIVDFQVWNLEEHGKLEISLIAWSHWIISLNGPSLDLFLGRLLARADLTALNSLHFFSSLPSQPVVLILVQSWCNEANVATLQYSVQYND